MGLRFFRRINNGQGWGLNLSGSGVSTSYRSKYGAIGSKGFSIRTGIPGLSFRSGWANGKGNGAIILFVIIISIGMFYVALIVIYNLLLFLIWLITEFYKLVLRFYYRRKMNQNIIDNEGFN